MITYTADEMGLQPGEAAILTVTGALVPNTFPSHVGRSGPVYPKDARFTVKAGAVFEVIVGPCEEKVATESSEGRWKCSGCGTRAEVVGSCYGYCQDGSGESCDGLACPGCGRFHYWTSAPR